MQRRNTAKVNSYSRVLALKKTLTSWRPTFRNNSISSRREKHCRLKTKDHPYFMLAPLRWEKAETLSFAIPISYHLEWSVGVLCNDLLSSYSHVLTSLKTSYPHILHIYVYMYQGGDIVGLPSPRPLPWSSHRRRDALYEGEGNRKLQLTMGFHITFKEIEKRFFKIILWLQFSSKIVETFFTW